jgi:diguanylate cyclase (GGDEF)-like protein/PAS domain S-box-containing protein
MAHSTHGPDYQTPVRGLRAVFEHSAVGIALLDRDCKILHANGALGAFLGTGAHEVHGSRITDYLTEEDAESTAALLVEVSTGGRICGSVEARFVRSDARVAWGALSVSLAGETSDLHLVVILQDVTERKVLESELVYQAYHDPLTKLPNRSLFRDRVAHALTRAERTPEQVAVIFLDLDNFKEINDTLGHEAGDRLLEIVARRLLSATRGCDTVARFGGDEFAVLLEQVGAREGSEAVMERIVAALRQPAGLEADRTVTIGASIGIAYHSGSETADELLRNADVAMYEAKLRNRGRWVVFDSAMHAALVDRVRLEVDLRQALERCQLLERPRLADTGKFPAFESRTRPENEFSVAYQPIVDLGTGRIVFLEALARWTHPTRGPISPDAFIPLVERSGAVCALGAWILRKACRQAATWNLARPEEQVSISVNLSGKQLEHPQIVSEVDTVLRETGLPAHLLVLEITETVIMQNAETTLSRLTELKALGLRLAIDDFGTGYSSLSYLQRFPVEIVKIDRVFTEGLRRGAEGTALIRTIMALAEMLSLQTIAEGIEEPCQREQLHMLGCNAGQGYLFGRPLTGPEADALLAEGAQLQVKEKAS